MYVYECARACACVFVCLRVFRCAELGPGHCTKIYGNPNSLGIFAAHIFFLHLRVLVILYFALLAWN